MARRTEPLTRDDLKLVSFRDFCELADVSIPTGKRILKSPDGPPVIQLHKRRIGIRMVDLDRWFKKRVRS